MLSVGHRVTSHALFEVAMEELVVGILSQVVIALAEIVLVMLLRRWWERSVPPRTA